MARIRTIKPEFWTSEQVVECSPTARLLFVGIWNFADDAGIHPASVRRLKMEIFPGDSFGSDEIEMWVEELIAAELLVEYEVQGKSYWQVTGWHHQKIDKPNFRYPSPTGRIGVVDQSSNGSRTVDDHSPPEGKGRESKGKESKDKKPPKSPKGDSVQDASTYQVPAADWLPPLQEWIDYKRSRGQRYKDRRWWSKALKDLTTVADFRSAVDHSIKNNYAGLFLPREDASRTPGSTLGDIPVLGDA